MTSPLTPPSGNFVAFKGSFRGDSLFRKPHVAVADTVDEIPPKVTVRLK